MQYFPESIDPDPSEEIASGSYTEPTSREDVSRSADHGLRLSNENILNPEDNKKDCSFTIIVERVALEISDFPLVSEIQVIVDETSDRVRVERVDAWEPVHDADPVRDVARLKTWIQKFRDQNVPVDINCIVRYASFVGRNGLVKYLVEDEGASLRQKDTKGRSAIFYAAAYRHVDMLEYIRGRLDYETFREEMSHQDENRRTPFYYAAIFSSLGNIDYGLAADARPADDDIRGTKLAESSDVEDKHIALLLILYTQLKSYLKFPVYAESFKSEEETDRGLSTIDSFLRDSEALTKWQNKGNVVSSERTLNWIHIPWTNVS